MSLILFKNCTPIPMIFFVIHKYITMNWDIIVLVKIHFFALIFISEYSHSLFISLRINHTVFYSEIKHNSYNQIKSLDIFTEVLVFFEFWIWSDPMKPEWFFIINSQWITNIFLNKYEVKCFPAQISVEIIDERLKNLISPNK